MGEKRIAIEEECEKREWSFFVNKYDEENHYSFVTFSVDKNPVGNPPHFVVSRYQILGLALNNTRFIIDVAHSLEEGVEQAYGFALTCAKEIQQREQQQFGETYKLVDETSRSTESQLEASAQS